jgi:hypothetical protein
MQRSIFVAEMYVGDPEKYPIFSKQTPRQRFARSLQRVANHP